MKKTNLFWSGNEIHIKKNVNWRKVFLFQFSNDFPESSVKPTFSLSTRGKPKLIHEGYSYVRASENRNQATRWRCSYSLGQRYACNAKAITGLNNESVSFIGSHWHPPKFDWIPSIRNVILSPMWNFRLSILIKTILYTQQNVFLQIDRKNSLFVMPDEKNELIFEWKRNFLTQSFSFSISKIFSRIIDEANIQPVNAWKSQVDTRRIFLPPS